MDVDSPIESMISVTSNEDDNVEELLKLSDQKYWAPEEDDKEPEITVTVTEEEEPITDIIVIGEFEEFTVTILDKDDNVIVDDEPSENGRVTLEKEVPGKTVKIVFTPTTDGTVKVDTVEVKYCAEPGIAIY
ncbi:hypothetical protein LSH36_2467g00002 [Paralvinella palmiformis]|uniref:Uncharacterized protein n=1 Tax=Paralvinella palmiformis TaxID=53620 RepID=A0AAD9IR08_9ANNE|nr:hypothetical protein LSH36_2467g00002 [Paralvinella palmiformis]